MHILTFRLRLITHGFSILLHGKNINFALTETDNVNSLFSMRVVDLLCHGMAANINTIKVMNMNVINLVETLQATNSKGNSNVKPRKLCARSM